MHLLDADGFIKEPVNMDQWQSIFASLDGSRVYDGRTLLHDTPVAFWSFVVVGELGTRGPSLRSEAFHTMTVEHHSNILSFLMNHAGIKRNQKLPSGKGKS